MKDINKVYIVTKGYYSDYSIYKVFIDKELADEYAKQIGDNYDEGNVEEFEISQEKDILPKNFRSYRLIMDIEGNILEHYGVTQCGHSFFGANKDYAVCPYPKESLKSLHSFVVNTDKGKEGAIKIANERRIQLILENKFGVINH